MKLESTKKRPHLARSLCILLKNRMGGVMVSMLALSAVDCGVNLRLGQIKDYKIGNCCFSAKYAALRSKSKY